MTRLPLKERTTETTNRLPKTLEILFGAVILLELIAPFTPRSYGLDGGYHLAWIQQFSDLFVHGIWMPRWSPTALGGFGAATFYIYPPLTFYVASVVRVISGITSPSDLFQLTGVVGTVASFFTCRFFLQTLSRNRYQTTVGALLYAFGPIRIFDLYTRCSLSSHLAYVFFPLVWMGLVLIQRKPDFQGILLFSIALAMLALTSVPLTVALALCIIPAAVVCRRWLNPRGMLATVLSGMMAIALSAFHFASALAAEPYTRIQEEASFSPSPVLNFLQIKSAGTYNALLIFLACAIIGLSFWRAAWRESSQNQVVSKNRFERMSATLVLIFLGLYVFSCLQFFAVFINSFEPLRLMQFASRLWPQIMLAIVVVIGIASSGVLRRGARIVVWLLVLGSTGPAALATFNLHLSRHSEALAGDAEEYRPIYTNSREQLEKSLKEHAVDPSFLSNLASGESLQIFAQTPERDSIKVLLNQPHRITFHQFFWPYQHLMLGNEDLPMKPDTIGRATALLPAGKYQCELGLTRTPLEYAGLWTSGFTAVVLLGYFLVIRLRSPTKFHSSIP